MSKPSHSRDPLLSRRGLLFGASAGLSMLGLSAASPLTRRARARPLHPRAAADVADRRLLFVVCATGGASIIDSFMPVSTAELPSGIEPGSTAAYEPEQLVQPPGSAIRCVGPLQDTLFLGSDYSIEQFVAKYHEELTVVAHEVTSVNHIVAQKRSVNGAGIHGGRTIAEAVAARHGEGLPLANCTMAFDGFVEPGDDASLPSFARAELIGNPLTFAMSTHGSRGLAGAPPSAAVSRARRIRAELDRRSPFGQTFRDAQQLQRYFGTRDDVAMRLEAEDAIETLMLLPGTSTIEELGLNPSALSEELRAVFPKLDKDQWQQRGAMAFLLARHGLSCASTISLSLNPSFEGESIVDAPLAFDFSHTYHRATQNVMWGRVLALVDGLITLLRSHDYLGDPALGKMWDRSLIYIATDFGRDKIRSTGGEQFGTGHHVNNGSVLLSPRLVGNRVFGGVDPATLLTYGFDRTTGEPRPGTQMREEDIYSLIAQALDVDFAGRRDMSAVLA
ncbi:MAG: hypothetical protein AAGF11_05445 [Myxococcota bacterium]